ncbi:MAG: RNA polymerase sigma factor [Acidimicrobiia bacterium]
MEDLCNRLADDVDAAFPDLVACVRDDLYSGLLRMHGAEAEDLAQETLIRAYRALRGYDADRIRALRLRPWLWTIALNLGRNHARDQARRPRPVELEDRHPVSDPEPHDSVVWDGWLRRLPPAQRRAVVLRHVVDLSYADIAEITGRPEGTVKADVSRGLTKLRSIVEEP